MITDSEIVMDNLFLSYNKVLNGLHILKLKTASNKEICYSDVAQACKIMHQKHSKCRWVFTQKKKNKHYVLIEGFYWLMSVYFQNEKKLIDADIDFFVLRIQQYEKLLHLNSKSLWNTDMTMSELVNYFNRTYGTIKNVLSKMNRITNGKYKYVKDNEIVISSLGVEWLCKNHFKKKYLELLEEYKMELTEKYMEAGFPYDNF